MFYMFRNYDDVRLVLYAGGRALVVCVVHEQRETSTCLFCVYILFLYMYELPLRRSRTVSVIIDMHSESSNSAARP